MPVARSFAVGLVGVAGQVVEVEADLAQGLPGLTVIGLPDAALAEARDRVRAAVVNSGQPWPQRRITLALSPAWLPKRGSSFDLALAAAVLAAQGVVPADVLAGRVLLGAVPLLLLAGAAGLLARGGTARRGGLALLVWSLLVAGVLVVTGLGQDWARAADVARVVTALAVAVLGVPVLLAALNLRALAARPAPAPRPAGCAGCACAAGGCGSR